MSSWRDVYYGDLQSLWALIAIPFAFVVYRAVLGTPRGGEREEVFITFYTLGWALETVLDPIVGGPVSRALGWADGFAGTVVMFAFVLLGDLRVFVLVFGLASPHYLPRALGFSLIVPLATGFVYGTVSWLASGLHSQVMWLIYELGFFSMAIWLLRVWIPQGIDADRLELQALLRSCVGYVAVYYALWAACDVLIMFGVDEGWALRMLPNQLYYALWIPFVHARYFALRSR
jgi:hypothetical protein